MSDMIAAYIGTMSAGFFIKQVLAIFLLFLFGCLINLGLCKGEAKLTEVLLGFPVGISVYSLVSFLLLVSGISFNVFSITGICSAVALICIIVLAVSGTKNEVISVKYAVVCLITVLCIAVISTSGLLSVSISNDSLYYYDMYPHAITVNEGLRMQFNVFLTDVGQTSAILNTLPFMYGFNEGFGIQTFMNINTLFIVIYALYGQAKVRCGRKTAVAATAMLTAFLICSMPYIVMAKWAMSNGYFMNYMFICVYMAFCYAPVKGDAAAGAEGEVTGLSAGRGVIMGILFVMMSLLRMEGCIIALILVLCFSVFPYTNRQLFMYFILPVFAVSVLYDIRIFILMKIDAPYTFLTPKKALIQIAAIAVVSVYILFMRGRMLKIFDRYMGIVLPAGLILVNMLLFVRDRALFMENAKAFALNFSNQSGWGLFPMLIIGVYLMCVVVSFGRPEDKGDKTISESIVRSGFAYWDLCFVSYMLTAIAVSFARDDALRESIADSGNRVMLQVTLIAFFAAAVHVIGIIGIKSKDGQEKDNC